MFFIIFLIFLVLEGMLLVSVYYVTKNIYSFAGVTSTDNNFASSFLIVSSIIFSVF